MEQGYGMESGEKETKDGSQSITGAGKKFRKSEKTSITPETLLQVLTQDAFEIQESKECQERNIKIQFVSIEGGIAVVILGTQLSQERILIPGLPRTGETNV